MILTLPDGSAIDSRYIAAITWEKATSGEYGRKPAIRIHSPSSDSMLGFGRQSGLQQTHYVPMESDEAAKAACDALVSAWTGKALESTTA